MTVDIEPTASHDPHDPARLTDLDLYLFNEGTHRRLWRVPGPQPVDGGGTRFAVWAPNARAVSVVGDWNDWVGEPMAPAGSSGIWSVVTAAAPGHHYKLDVTGADARTVRKADPMARRTEAPPSDASVVPSFDEFEWHDHDWLAGRGAVLRGEAPMRIYEVHLGSWRDGVDDWGSLAEHLGDHLVDLGFTHVELLPIAEHPFTGSWG